MDAQSERIISKLVGDLEKAWNAGDGEGFARPFADDADFVTIRGEHHRTREGIAKGHQAIFDTIYKGSVVRYQVAALRAIVPEVLLVHVKSGLKVPIGPLAGEHSAFASLVFVGDDDDWRIAAFHNTLVRS